MTDQGISRLAEWVSRLEPGDRHPGLFWAACRAAELDLDPEPLAEAAGKTGLQRDEIDRTISSAAETIAKDRRDHEKLDPPPSR